jgi:peptidoglycan/LPS O-acetylase OafA/YrhL
MVFLTIVPAFALGILAQATAPDAKPWMRQVVALAGALFLGMLAIAISNAADIRTAALAAAASYYIGTQQVPLFKRILRAKPNPH